MPMLCVCWLTASADLTEAIGGNLERLKSVRQPKLLDPLKQIDLVPRSGC